MPGIDPGTKRSKYCRQRQFSPKKCDPRSFRVKKISKNVKFTICCPRNKWDAKKKRCKVGTRTQSIMKRFRGKYIDFRFEGSKSILL